MTKRKNRYFIFVFPLLLVLLTGVSISSTAKADSNTLDISTTQESWYHINLELDGVSVYLNDYSSLSDGWHPLAKLPDSFDATVIFDFPNVTHEGKSVLVTAVTRVNNVLSGSVKTYHFNFAGNVRVNIRESYYNLFHLKGNDFSTYKVTWFYDNKGWQGYDKGGFAGGSPEFSGAVTFTSEPKPDGADDPNSPNFEGGDNGGLDTSPLYSHYMNWWYNFYKWLTGWTHWKISYEAFTVVALAVSGLLIIVVTALVVGRNKRK